MAFDPRYVAFEGRLHADCRTAEYIGRANHDADAACFRSRCAVDNRTCSRIFYFETQIVATCPDKFDNVTSSRSKTANCLTPTQVQDNDIVAHNRQQLIEREAMDMEDIEREHSEGIPRTFNVNLSSRTIQQMRSRLDHRRVRRNLKKSRFQHQVAVGFLMDTPEPIGIILSTNCPSKSGYHEVKDSMQLVINPSALPDGTLETSGDEEYYSTKDQKIPTILHRNLGEMKNSVAYVGKTGFIVSHGHKFLRCERYGAGDVVGCGILFDTNTFFFTLNGKLMGMLAARSIYDLDDFEAIEMMYEEDFENEDEEEHEKEEVDEGMGILLDRINDVDMDDLDARADDKKALFPTVSLHGVGELVHGVFDLNSFLFDLSSFEQQIQQERQCALEVERTKRNKNIPLSVVEQERCQDEVIMVELVRDYFLHYGYATTYEAFEAALMPMKCQQTSTGVNESDKVSSNTTKQMEFMEDESKRNDLNGTPSQTISKTHQMFVSLNLRNEVRDYIRSFRTAQALVVLEHNIPTLLKHWSEHQRNV
ncbi:putative SPRY domain-containing protein [Plasmopara halstedii]